ncbi:hypothetical protein JO379_000038 [Streptomyces syringium]|uniref:Uncharacterized protein n=1 Tax=Streptomyces syringium TaxID=76729 RepID=A0ABS4XVN2_9ACTN|nr:hypothetical protein [Streptomyces syringium]
MTAAKHEHAITGLYQVGDWAGSPSGPGKQHSGQSRHQMKLPSASLLACNQPVAGIVASVTADMVWS